MKVPLLTILMWALVVTSPPVLQHHGRLSHSRLTTAQPQQSATGTPPDTDRIVSAFTAKETEFRNALAQYSFKRDAVVQTIGPGGQISGEYRRTSLLAVDASGKRIEKILFFPTPTLRAIGISSDDLDDLGGVQLFALEASKAPLYNFKYLGTERIDELDLHVFEVSPKQLPDPKKVKERLFKGRIWVDTQGNQIVKLRGIGLPQPKIDPYPTLEIYREEIDGFWFPTYAYADEELTLGSGDVVKIRMRIRFSEFEKVNRK
ncbi:MAG TPA: hypothetical protein VGW76_09065 [Pyrinomonadaceae bacterium]|nr:hypothetical protein [Pyrinomonadaceae bacterium]